MPCPHCDSAVLCLLLALALFQQLCPSAAIDADDLNSSERDDLLKFRDSMNSSYNLHSRWTGPPCIGDESRWVGVGCSNSHVVHLVLDGIRLNGSLPDNFLSSVTFLTRISLRNNSISGALPALTGLQHLEEVSLSENEFSGPIPGDYVALPKLTKLELQGNFLTGGIPPFQQQSLVLLNVSYNRLDGPIPDTSTLRYFSKSSYDHNPGLCGIQVGVPCPVPSPSPMIVSPPRPIPTPTRRKSISAQGIVLIAVSAAVVPFLVMGFFLCYYRKAVHGKEETKETFAGGSVKFTQTREDPRMAVELEFFNREAPVFDLDDLLRASAEVLGKGKLGTTYKAILESGSVVCAKRLKNMNGLSKKEFVQQMKLLGNLKHENVVEIISFYCSKDEKLVIYEFFPDGNLFDLLHGHRGAGRVPLNWSARISIIKDIAKGLHFLHQSLSSQRVPHANLKSSNILVRRDSPGYRAKLVDFGFWPLLPSRKLSEVLSVGKTPEFLQLKKVTSKADIYCFGIVILEIVTGKIPGEISPGDEDEEKFNDLSDWVRMVVNNDWSTDILDLEISGDRERQDEMLKLTELALECTDEAAEKRPKIDEVLGRIEEIEQRSRGG